MPDYNVKWEIDLNADSPQEAAIEAMRVQRDVSSIASVFTVTDEAGNQTVVDAVI
ncbi:hypothetical protein ES703_118872 [subsurface metagenome]